MTGLVMTGLAVAAVPQADAFGELLIAMLAYGAGLAITTGATAALVTDLADRARYGAAHGLFGTLYDMGDVTGPLAGGLLVAAFGYQWAFTCVALAAVAVAMIFAVLSARWR